MVGQYFIKMLNMFETCAIHINKKPIFINESINVNENIWVKRENKFEL